MFERVTVQASDVEASARRFYAHLAPRAGLRLGTDTAERVQCKGNGGSFSLVAGTPTEHAAMAFAAAGPAESLTDPDGNRIELVG